MSKEIIVKEIGIKDRIHYVPITHNYGRAEFLICFPFKRGRLTEIFIYRMQQPDEPEQAYHIDLIKELPASKIDCFYIETYLKDHPKIWRNFWCKQHKALSFEVYVPSESSEITFDFHFGDAIDIKFN